MISNRNASVSITSVLMAVLAAALIGLAGLISIVYIPQIDQQNSQIVDKVHQIDSLNATINGLNDQISTLNDQVKDLQDQLGKYTASLATALGVKKLVDETTNAHYLYIRGYVTNTGITEAYNAGLHVVGYGPSHEVLINMTSPLEGGTFQSGFASSNSRSQLYPTQSQNTMLSIYHQGTVVSWDIVAVWTNNP